MLLLQELLRTDPTSPVPVYLQLTNSFIHHIRSGRLRKGLKLPGSRELARLLKLNRMTLVAVYGELQAQGWIEMLPRKGTFVRKDLPELKPRKLQQADEVFQLPSRPLFSFHSPVATFPTTDYPDGNKLIINDGFPDSRLAPVQELVAAMRSRFKIKANRKYLMYGGPAGTGILRQVLADFLKDTRGLPLTAGNLLITRGAQMGIYLAASALIRPGDCVVVGEPGYFGANRCFLQLGAAIHRVPVDHEGLLIDAIEEVCKKKKVKLVYAVPHHHYPTTVTLTPKRRIRLLDLAARYRFAVIEDDYDYDFHYASKPMMPMASLDRHGSVIYIGTLTKTLAPAFRIGFMVAPEGFIEAVSHLRRSMDWQGDSMMENAIAALYHDGTISRHIKKSVKLYRERRDHFCKLLQSELAEHLSFNVPDGGMSVWARFASCDLQWLSAEARKKGLVISDGSLYNTGHTNYNSLRMGFASLDFSEQEQAVGVLKMCLEKR